jgi:hypothetical protein
VLVNILVIRETGLEETIMMMSLAQAGECGGAGKVAKFTPRASGSLDRQCYESLEGLTVENNQIPLYLCFIWTSKGSKTSIGCRGIGLLVFGKCWLLSSLHVAFYSAICESVEVKAFYHVLCIGHLSFP